MSYQRREITASVILCPDAAADDLQGLQLELWEKEGLTRKQDWHMQSITKSHYVQLLKITFSDDLTGLLHVVPTIIVKVIT